MPVNERIGVDVGGTFTDLVALTPEGELRVEKVSTTTADQSRGFMTAIERVQPGEHVEIVHGTTVGTNAILERRGAATALIATEGFRDVLELQDQERSSIWDLAYRKAEPLIPRDRCFEIRERLDANGEVVLALDEADLARLVAEVGEREVESIAVCLLHAYRNGEHERAVERSFTAGDSAPYVVVSSELAPQFREYDRASTTVMSAYIGPVVSRYLLRLSDALRARGLRRDLMVMQSNGGVLPVARTSASAIGTALSGPAGGVMAAKVIAELVGEMNVISFDMGGTSTDVALIADGEPQIAARSMVSGLPVVTPMFRMDTVGAGGGSIARVDEGGLLHVGPESAGSEPGPAAYGRGAVRPTVTDALVTLGLLGTRQPLSDEFVLDGDAARSVVEGLAGELGIDLHSAAAAIVRIADHTMAQSVRRVSLNQGYDPRDFAVIAFGGAGPMHAARVADELDIRHVIVPPNAGVFSAVGLLCTDTRTDHVFSDLSLLDDFNDASLATHLERYVARAHGEDAPGDDGVQVVLGLDLRYLEQTYSLTLAVDRQPSLREVQTRFHELHERRYGFSQPDVPVELVNVRVALVSHRDKVTRLRQAPAAGAAPREVLEAHVDGEQQACTFVARTDLRPGEALAGPAVVEEKTATTFVPTGWTAAVDDHEVLHLRREED